MTINNKNRASWIKLSYYVFTLLFVASMALITYLNPDNINWYLGAATIKFIIIVIASFSFGFNYLSYQITDHHIILRYYPLHPFHDKCKSFEIPRDQFSHFEIQNKIFGLRPEITIFQNTSKGVAKYPPVSFSGFSRKDRNIIIRSMEKLSIKKN